MPTVPISSEVLSWATEQSGWDERELASKLKVEPESLRDWLSGESLPSTTEFRKLVSVLRRPSAMFFLPSPPVEAGLGPEYRSAPGASGRQLEPDELVQIRSMRRLQRGLSEVLERLDAPRVDMPAVAKGVTPAVAARIARQSLGVEVETQLSWSSGREAFVQWRQVFASRSIYVVQLQLGVKSIRGFSLWDDRAPVIAVNTAYNYPARTFSAFHELGHMLRRSFAACVDLTYRGGISSPLESWCEEFAAAALMPEDAVREVSAAWPADDRFGFAVSLAEAFSVSIRAAALRAIALDLVESDGFYAEVDNKARVWDRSKEVAYGQGGRDTAEKRVAEYGAAPMEAFLNAFDSRMVSERDLRRYLRVDGQQITDLRERLAHVSP